MRDVLAMVGALALVFISAVVLVIFLKEEPTPEEKQMRKLERVDELKESLQVIELDGCEYYWRPHYKGADVLVLKGGQCDCGN